MAAPEHIPDEDPIHRLIDFPFMYDNAKGLLFDNVFQFPKGAPESLVWGKYAPLPVGIRAIGCARELRKQSTKPEMRYVGYISATTGKVRGISTAAGHGFDVKHAPDEGIHHAEIVFRSATDVPIGKGQRNELKLGLRAVFGNLISQTCP